jgi:hypothetical protein
LIDERRGIKIKKKKLEEKNIKMKESRREDIMKDKDKGNKKKKVKEGKKE